MILHLLFDDKFGDYAIRQFSGSEMHSEFVRITESLDNESMDESVRSICFDSGAFQELKAVLGLYKAVVFHGLFYPWQESLLRSVPEQVKVAWVFWGGDIYGRRDLNKHFLTPTSKFLLWLHGLKRNIQLKAKTDRYEIPFDTLRRIDYCLTDIPEDFEFVRKYFDTPIKELWYNYYSIDETLGDLATETVDGVNIVVGNSATLECNHLDGFRALSGFPLNGSEVIVPLSYGEPWVRNLVIKSGKYHFGSHFHPLVEFLPRNEYNRLIKSCAVAIMPHYRPQAFGNILTLLWLGTRVYLSERNTLLSFFKRIGTLIFSIERDFKESNPQVMLPLGSEEILQNRKALLAIYGKKEMHQKIIELVNNLNQ